MGEPATFAVPVLAILRQLLLTLMVPVLTGMALRRLWSGVMERHQRGLFGLSLVALAALIGFVIAHEAEHFVSEWPGIALMVVLLSGLAMLAACATGWLCRADATDRFTMGIIFVERNVGIATAIAVTVLGDLEFAVFATAYFLSQVPLLLAAVTVFRRVQSADRTTRNGADLR